MFNKENIMQAAWIGIAVYVALTLNEVTSPHVKAIATGAKA